MNPFVYPKKPHTRKHDPRGYAHFREFKPWLQDEFVFRCVYCFRRETWFPDGDASFAVEHLMAKDGHPDLERSYQNLFYACNRCNSFKGTQDLGIDPCQNPLGNLIEVNDDGCVQPRNNSKLGAFIINALRLDHGNLTEFRQRMIASLRSLKKLNHPDARALLIQHLTFPRELPNLGRKAPPDGNRNRGSEQQSFHARRSAGMIPKTYFGWGA